ncbi:hypothetical protein, partial [Rhizobium sp. WW_1]|uniref:hypothetical protein n=1 Tax=Rhizobium sp. WW_1 TaxID=1907375 RepID=UPI001AEC8DE4
SLITRDKPKRFTLKRPSRVTIGRSKRPLSLLKEAGKRFWNFVGIHNKGAYLTRDKPFGFTLMTQAGEADLLRRDELQSSSLEMARGGAAR